MQKNHLNSGLNKLVHPVFILALALILLNAVLFQPLSPNWLTGKLADLGWMIVLPVVAATVLAAFWRGSERICFWISASVIALCFSLMKVNPSINDLARGLFFDLFKIRLKLILDPSDLLALVGIFVGAWIWQQDWRLNRRMWRFAPLILLIMAGMADAVDPGYDQIDCLALDEDAIIAFTPERSLGYLRSGSERKAYLSKDNGHTWEDLGEFSTEKTGEEGTVDGIQVAEHISECRPWNQQALVVDPNNSSIQYLIVSDQGIYRSGDGGDSMVREFPVSEGVYFKDVTFAPDGQTLVVAASQHGILLRLHDGNYTWADPSGMSLSPGD